jgi:hypothetical protein
LFRADATWADTVVLPRINATLARAAGAAAETFDVMDLSAAFIGHRLCERGSARLSETRLPSWQAPHAVDRVEWVNQVYLALFPQQVQESLHPGYWGTAAERACLRLVLQSGPRPAYRCVGAGQGLVHGDPRMRLVAAGS